MGVIEVEQPVSLPNTTAERLACLISDQLDAEQKLNEQMVKAKDAELAARLALRASALNIYIAFHPGSESKPEEE